MPVRVTDEQGTTHVFPDGSTPEMIAKAMKVKYNGGKSPTAPPKKLGFLDRLTEIQKPDSKDKWNPREAVKAVGNIGAGGMGMLLHPVDTLAGVGGMVTAPFEMMGGRPFKETVPGELLQSLKENPYGTIEAGIGQAGVTGLVEGAAVKGAGKVADLIKPGTRVTKELVKSTQEANAAEAESASKKNADIDAKRKLDLKKHFDKTQQVRAANTAKDAAESRKTALQKGVKRLDPEVKEGLEATRDKVNAEANAKYSALAAKLDPIEANPEFLPNAVDEAFQKIKGSDTEPTILKDMARRFSRTEDSSDPLTYRDLQGYRSELGKELAKGSLPGDVFHAYKGLQEAVTNEMQRIADANGQGPQFKEARDFYRRYAETFIDRGSPVRRAIKAPERGGVAKALSGKDQSGIEAVAQFDPGVARKANTVRGYSDEAAGIRPSATRAAEPTLSPKPTGVIPKVQKIGDAENVAANKEALAKRSDAIRNRGGTWANTFVILDAIRNAIHGNVAGIGEDIAVRGVFGVGKHALANFLERPEVVEFMTKTTPEQIAAIPPELRGDFPAIIQVAKSQGIPVSPALIAAFAGPPKKRVGDLIKK